MTSHERGVANLAVKHLPAQETRTKVGADPSSFKIWAEIVDGNPSAININSSVGSALKARFPPK